MSGGNYLNTIFKSNAPALATSAIASWVLDANSHGRQTPAPSTLLPVKYDEVMQGRPPPYGVPDLVSSHIPQCLEPFSLHPLARPHVPS